MLIRLEIRDFAVISHAVFEPENGFNVISGETGAGKSLLIDAIGLILGEKASRSLIRTDSDDAFVEALFDVSDNKDPDFLRSLAELGIECDDDQLIISRKISKDGKSIARINGRTVILAILKTVASYLIDIHGQHDTQKIFDSGNHIDMLDSFGGGDIGDVLDEYQDKLQEFKSLVMDIRRLSQMHNASDMRREQLEYAISEITNADFKPGDEETLDDRRRELMLLEKNASIIKEADEYLSSEDMSGMSAVTRMEHVSSNLLKLSSQDDRYKALSDKASSLFLECGALADEVRELTTALEYDPSEADMITSRLGLLYDLKLKYGKTIEDINNYVLAAGRELDELRENEAELIRLKKARVPLEEELKEISGRLSGLRHDKAQELSSAIAAELKELEIPDARFEVDFKERPKDKYFSAKGTEDVVFMFSANPGEALRDLSVTASGGEASRIMLAIKNILSEADKVPTLVFDEIDTGVSGKASLSIARKLISIAGHHQVLCITHTAQLAAGADHNFLISKSVDDGRTSAVIKALDDSMKISEVSRLLSGTDGEESVDLAKKLIGSLRGELRKKPEHIIGDRT